jgi:crotonobetainyl-CoA:carnitine CoA-transferase CaiB-like acyl-CoA transferase
MVVVSGHPAERGTFDLFVAAMQQPELLNDARFSDVATRLEHFDELMDVMKAWAKTVPTSDEIENQLSQYQLAVGRLRSVGELADTQWAHEREAVVEVSDRGNGTVRIPNSPWHFSGSDTSTQGDAKYRGEDNHTIFSEITGLSSEEIAQLENDGVLVSRGPSKR